MDVANMSKEKLFELLQADDLIFNHLFSFIKPFSLQCAVQIGIFDAIHSHGKPMAPSEMGSALLIHPEKVQFLPHLLRILTHMGYFSEHTRDDGNNGYVLTPLSELLLRDHPFTLRTAALALPDPALMKPWHLLSSWFQNNEQDPFNMANGISFWEYAGREPEFNKNFNHAMANDSKLVASILIKNPEWKGIFDGASSLVDVAGGQGEMAKAIANTYPHIKCIVLDLPHVIEGSQGTDNLVYVAGDMFEGVPPADIVLLKWILHNWSDENSVKIMKQCRKAILGNGGRGKVVIIDAVMDIKHETFNELREFQLFYSIEMMMMVLGKERTEPEWKKIFKDAGFTGGYKIYPGLGKRSFIEVYP